MPKTIRSITCCYCDAATMVDLTKLGRGVLTCDACGARLQSARMEALACKAKPVKQAAPKHRALSPRWQGRVTGPFGPPTHAVQPARKAKKSRPKKRKSFLDRLEDIWDEVEDIFD